MKTRAREAIRELDRSLIEFFVDQFDGSEIVRNIFELDLLAARIARVNAINIMPATIYMARVYAGAHPDDALYDMQAYYGCEAARAYKLLKASQEVRLNCFAYLAKNIKL